MATGAPAKNAGHGIAALPQSSGSRHEPLPNKEASHVSRKTTDGFGSSFPGRDHVLLVKGRRSWILPQGWRLENNLILGVGFLELANAGDFAANIWNDIPVPIYAVILMAIGGTAAGTISIFAYLDSIRSWHNIKFLRRQQAMFQSAQARHLDDAQTSQTALGVIEKLTKRELWTEGISRWGMAVLMGIGAVLISIGTFMAIGGANRTVWHVSNLLSGYLGNAPIALFGLINASWQVVVWIKMHHHKNAAAKTLKDHHINSLIQKRCLNVQLYSIVNGTATIMGGVGSMLTPTYWWGYVILIPVIISSFFCNIWWRKKVGYDRPDVSSTLNTTPSSLIEELNIAMRIRKIIEDHQGDILAHLIPEREKPNDLMAFLTSHGLFEVFCLKLVNNPKIASHLSDPETAQLNIDEESIASLCDSHTTIFWETAEELLQVEGPKHFRHRRRFFLEFLGEFLSYTS
ncbi:hypothetical protein PFICI_04900 [Pestalotiopsis fici W106-1]|uniref:Integral membrane protein n=1 Tax=Pestalotiopsis fici (strain W106-1 / CGMCC3.15140) TaxID=1229662 RepID=W3XAG6_PESFW|nr:uncharacterized protein PFICI_04900 [Pestalotiopsis fici W106-1]ETS83024.1 hypothetical protein PFICI_04900 [Pestalotiopsis fici W106-1]